MLEETKRYQGRHRYVPSENGFAGSDFRVANGHYRNRAAACHPAVYLQLYFTNSHHASVGSFFGGSMNQEPVLIGQRMRTPRAAAIAGIVFSLLFITTLLLVWVSIPANPLGPATEVINHLKTISFSLNLMPFAGIAFLWFIAVVRDRLGELEDRFFATVFLGTGLLFIAMVFIAAAMAGGILTVLGGRSETLIQSGAYALGRAEIAQIMHIYKMKAAGVFMITTSHWMTVLGYVLALVLWLSVGTIQWIPLVFPLWLLLIRVYILAQNLPVQPAAAA
jgi:hypothetical protein